MSKKLVLLALAAVSAAAIALPAMAIAEDIPLHVVKQPEKELAITSFGPTLSTASSAVTCEQVTGTVAWESATTGTLRLTLGPNCESSTFGFTCTTTGEPSGNIKTNPMPFHLVTLPGALAGVLVTPPAGGIFATFTCGLITVSVKGNGLLGTITQLPCGGESSTATFAFQGTGGVQNHRKVEGTPETEYHLTAAGEGAALNAPLTFTFPEGKKKLECT